MRNAFADEICKLAAKDERIVLLSGDIGNRLFNPYKERFAGRFYNCGIAEANMTSVAAGMAMSGLKPVTYTITPFNTIRCLEQIRLDICYQNLAVVIVGVGAGLSYANLGPTHHSLEDIAILRTLPNMRIICPADATETRLALSCAFQEDGPVYIRIGKKNEPLVHHEAPQFRIGRGITLREGGDICILATGTIVPESLRAAQLLDQQDIKTTVVSLHTVKPLDEALLKQMFNDCRLVVTVEEHGLTGGLGSAVAEWLVDRQDLNKNLLRIGVPDKFIHSPGNLEQARKKLGLTGKLISARIKKRIMQLGFAQK